MKAKRIFCNPCGKPISSEFAPLPPEKPFIFRGWVECPECCALTDREKQHYFYSSSASSVPESEGE